MRKTLTLSPPNSLVLVMDHKFGKLPDSIRGRLAASTDSCVALGTLSEVDGKTTITLTDEFDGIEGMSAAFDGVLLTPNQELSVCSVMNEKLLTINVSEERTHTQVFVNNEREPDKIVVIARSSQVPPG